MKITFRFNRDKHYAEILADGEVLETCALADVPRRLASWRASVAGQAHTRYVEQAAYMRQQRREEV